MTKSLLALAFAGAIAVSFPSAGSAQQVIQTGPIVLQQAPIKQLPTGQALDGSGSLRLKNPVGTVTVGPAPYVEARPPAKPRSNLGSIPTTAQHPAATAFRAPRR
jgi:hypothetical protein